MFSSESLPWPRELLHLRPRHHAALLLTMGHSGVWLPGESNRPFLGEYKFIGHHHGLKKDDVIKPQPFSKRAVDVISEYECMHTWIHTWGCTCACIDVCTYVFVLVYRIMTEHNTQCTLDEPTKSTVSTSDAPTWHRECCSANLVDCSTDTSNTAILSGSNVNEQPDLVQSQSDPSFGFFWF